MRLGGNHLQKREKIYYIDSVLIAGTDEHLDAVETRSRKTIGVASETDEREKATSAVVQRT